MFRPFHPLHLVLGPTIWSGWFVALYAGLSVACRLVPPAATRGAVTWINGLLLVLTVSVTLLLVFLAWRCWRAASADTGVPCNGPFISRVSAGVYLLTASSTVMIGLPVVLLPPCI